MVSEKEVEMHSGLLIQNFLTLLRKMRTLVASPRGTKHAIRINDCTTARDRVSSRASKAQNPRLHKAKRYFHLLHSSF